RPGRLWRYAQAGDLPGYGPHIDGALLQELVAANSGKNAIAFTHKPVLGDDPVAVENRGLITAAVKVGFTVNLSADNPAHAERLADRGIPPVVTVLARAYARRAVRHRFKRRRDEWAETIGDWRDRTASLPRYTQARRRIAICPATYSDAACKTCGACAGVRDAVIGFPAHGAWQKVEKAIAHETCRLASRGYSVITRRWLRSSPRRQQQPDAFALPISRWVGPRRWSIPLRKESPHELQTRGHRRYISQMVRQRAALRDPRGSRGQ